MSVLHICNTFFEAELEAPAPKPLLAHLRSHPVLLQLQFLPLLYAAPTDQILVSDLPSNPDPRLTLSPPSDSRIEHWGPSTAISTWAKKHRISYDIPDWEIVRQVNSKIFSFSSSSKLPGAELLGTEVEVRAWIEKTPGPKVLKTAFGTAGRGHFHVGRPGLDSFLRRQFNLGLPVIGESWVERLLDFSTQWRIGESVEFLGATAFENEPNGTYLATLVGSGFTPYEWALEEHLSAAKPLLEKIRCLGYFGNLGIDAYVYRWAGKEHIQPIVEINGRKTMSWVALQVGKKRFSYSAASSGLLPVSLEVEGKTVRFSRNIQTRAY